MVWFVVNMSLMCRSRAKNVVAAARPPVRFFSPDAPVVDLYLGQLDQVRFNHRGMYFFLVNIGEQNANGPTVVSKLLTAAFPLQVERLRSMAEVSLIFFYAPWCAHSMAARQEVQQVAKKLAKQVGKSDHHLEYLQQKLQKNEFVIFKLHV